LAALAMASFSSCSEKEPEPVNPGEESVELVAPVATASSTTVTVSSDNMSSEALKLSWTSAAPKDKDVAVVYSVYANLASKDLYTSPKVYSAGGQLEYSLKGEDLNSLVSELGAEVGSEVELQFSVYAKSDDDDIEAVVSNVVKVSVATFKEVIVLPSVLWIAGSATDAGWDTSKGIEMPMVGGGVYKAEGVNINVTINDTGFKLYFANDGSSDYFFGPDRKSEVFGTAMLYTEDDGSANLFQPAMNGYTSGKYTITFSAPDLKMTMTRTGDLDVKVEYGDNVYPLGSCFDWGWDFTNPMAKVSDKVYEIENVQCKWGDKGDSGFKIFLGEGKWSPYFAMTDDSSNGNIGIRLVTDSEAPQFYPGSIGYANGYYTIRADFNTMTLTLTEGENPNPGDGFDETKAFFLVGGGFEKYKEWSILRELALVDPDNDDVFVSESPIYLNKWCYFRIAKSDCSQDYSRVQGATNYWTAQLKAKDDEEPFIPGNANSDWVDGLYTVTFDHTNLTVTCTPASTDGPVVDQTKAFYIFGCNFEGACEDWTFSDDMALMPTTENANIYKTVKPVTLAKWCYFKFEKQDWTEYVRDQTTTDYWKVTPRVKEPADNDKGFSPGDTGFESGSYNVTLNLDDMSVTLTAAE